MYRFLIILLSITSPIFGQSHFGLRADLGISKSYDRQDQLKMHPVAKGGLFYEISLGQKSILGSELLFTQVNIKEEESGYVNKNTNDSYFIAIQTNRHISYLSIPLYYGLRFNNISVNLGIEPSYNLIYSFYKERETIINGVKNTESKKYKDFSNYFYLGARTAAAYQLNDRINLEVQYYLDFNKIIGDVYLYLPYTERVDQLTAGIKYILIK